MKARIVFSETGTNETETFDAVIDDLTSASVIDALNRLQKTYDGENTGEFSAESFVVQGDRAAFILSSHDKVWFGDMLWHGVVYTAFAGVFDPI